MSFPHPPDSKTTAWVFFFFFFFYKLKLYLPTPAGGFVIFCARITLGERNPSGQSL